MKRTLIFKDKKSNKFWTIEVKGSDFTVTYGKVNALGTSKLKSFESEEHCKKAANKLITQMLKKGYVAEKNKKVKKQTSTKKTTAPGNKNTSDFSRQFIAQFKYLSSTPASMKKLTKIAKKVTKMRAHKKNTLIDFENNMRLLAAPPALAKELKTWPKSMQRLLKKHGYLLLGDKSGSYDVDSDWSLGVSTFEPKYIYEDELSLLKFVDEPDEILCAIADISDWWLLHPTKKLKNGEAALVFFSHAGGGSNKTVSLGVGDFFIKSMHEYLN